MSPSRVVDLSTHFWARVDTSAGPEACWYWMLSTNAYGYGQLVMQQVHWIAHLFAYQDQIGLIPEGYEIDHICHNREIACVGGRTCPHRRCCNPRHLVAKMPLVNRQDADRPRQRAQFATHCPQGHIWSQENTGWFQRGKRGGKGRIDKIGKMEKYCKPCARDRMRARSNAD